MATTQLTRNGTELARWRPWADVFDWNAPVGRLLDSLWGAGDGLGEGAPGATLEEADESFVLEVDLPGVAKDDITIEASDNRISVKGERKEAERRGVLRRSTRVTGTFAYEVTMPTPIDGKGVTATMTDGVLKITAPKATIARATHVPIS
jgi:HSP20 family protein